MPLQSYFFFNNLDTAFTFKSLIIRRMVIYRTDGLARSQLISKAVIQTEAALQCVEEGQGALQFLKIEKMLLSCHLNLEELLVAWNY